MEFGEQIKKVRTEKGLTQEQFAVRLNVTRQAVSNWENDRNLPDIEMLILISEQFGVSLDQLILGGNKMNNMTQKLIADTGETRRTKLNLSCALTGAALMLIGLVCLVIKTLEPEYVDETGLLHESFFLIPVGLLFLLSGAAVTVISSSVYLAMKKRRAKAAGGDPQSE